MKAVALTPAPAAENNGNVGIVIATVQYCLHAAAAVEVVLGLWLA